MTTSAGQRMPSFTQSPLSNTIGPYEPLVPRLYSVHIWHTKKSLTTSVPLTNKGVRLLSHPVQIEHETSAVNVQLVAVLLIAAAIFGTIWLKCCAGRR
ncbi:hypothetical protein GSI_08728 [Ganoderma sinense ZZ0214-1]|uniref:Uncharacterized protein n=1 Tax=Ganoderma sinense ZZ0214-1 TaxID=1077348 RepID=A0A2G8S4M5_9APHY|nr:hypothetical protein GSI_08728 [Ganoderma sinense ZZ0214-1]